MPVQIHNDQDWILQATKDDPIVGWMDDSGNFPGSCGTTGPVRTSLPFPAVATDCVPNNNGAALLLPDNRTLVQMQPLYRAETTGNFVAWYHTGAPQPFPWTVDVLGDGNLGAHGGSGLSSFGGTIRTGELLPATGPIRHALKLELWAHGFYFLWRPRAAATHGRPSAATRTHSARTASGTTGRTPSFTRARCWPSRPRSPLWCEPI